MAYQQNKWWLDERFMNSLGVESMYDSMLDEMRFRKSIDGSDILEYMEQTIPVSSLKDITVDVLLDGFRYLDRSRPEFRHDGPTNEDLRHPAVRNAWNEFLVIKRLSLGNHE